MAVSEPRRALSLFILFEVYYLWIQASGVAWKNSQQKINHLTMRRHPQHSTSSTTGNIASKNTSQVTISTLSTVPHLIRLDESKESQITNNSNSNITTTSNLLIHSPSRLRCRFTIFDRVSALEAGQAHMLKIQISLLKNQQDILARLDALESRDHRHLHPGSSQSPYRLEYSFDESAIEEWSFHLFNDSSLAQSHSPRPPVYIPPPPALKAFSSTMSSATSITSSSTFSPPRQVHHPHCSSETPPSAVHPPFRQLYRHNIARPSQRKVVQSSTSWQGFIYNSVYLAYFAIAKLLLTASYKIK